MKIPSVPVSFDITELFRNFAIDWTTLQPVLYVLYGILFATFLLGLVIKRFREED